MVKGEFRTDRDDACIHNVEDFPQPELTLLEPLGDDREGGLLVDAAERMNLFPHLRHAKLMVLS